MIIGLVALLIALLGSGSESPYAIPYAKESITEVIENKDRKKEVKALIKIFEKDFSSFQKAEKKQLKEKKNLNKDFYTNKEDIILLFNAAKLERLNFGNRLIDERIKVQAFLTQKEWKDLTHTILLKIEEKEWKKSKKEIKNNIKKNEAFQKIKNNVIAVFDDKDKQKNATAYFNDFENSITAHVYANQTYTKKMLYLAKNQHPTKEEINELVAMQELFRSDLGFSFIEMRTNLIKISTEKQWKKIANNINNFIL